MQQIATTQGTFERPKSVDDAWINAKTNPPKGDEGLVWVAVSHTSQSCDDYRVLLLHSGYMTYMNSGGTYTHWKRANLIIPELPGRENEPAPTISDDACLAAWRDANPDYAPDEVPSDEFIEGFKAAQEAFKAGYEPLNPADVEHLL